jgi:hypothetical protein
MPETYTDLLGHEVKWSDVPAPDAKRKPTQRKGYRGRPGTGPAGETCGTCKHLCRFKKYSKCGLMHRLWTNGLGTDILQKSPACNFWQKYERPRTRLY